MRIALVGAGRVGVAVASLLRDAGHDIAGVASRSPSSAGQAAARLGTETLPFDGVGSIDADLVLIGVTDDAIEKTAIDIAPRVGPEALVAHFAGSLGPSALGPLGVPPRGCALHPVQACPDVDTAIRRLPGSAWGVTAPEGPTHISIHALITDDLHGHPVDVDEAVRPLWHAAAVTTSNGIAALLATGESIMASIGIVSPETVLGPLAAGTVANAAEGGGGSATLTGPVVRGEAATIARHLSALRAQSPELAKAYTDTVRMIAASAALTGRISEDIRAQIEEVLRP
ncbi:MAG: Rossmann-like and DUF2520 domain-containing protein [Actinomycetota bacterium]